MLAQLTPAVRQYLLITGNYWAFTLTDGALRMLVVLHFHQLGYSPLQIAMLFLFYEVFGVVTNLVGGWLGARIGLNRTMNIGLGLQVIALAMLAVIVILATGIGGFAKGGDFNRKHGNRMMRWRLYAQAAALVILMLFLWLRSI